jgi:hypothetical protein
MFREVTTMFSLNSPDAIIVHAAAPGDGADAPLCGWLATVLDGVQADETISPYWSRVTCRDCIAARGGPDDDSPYQYGSGVRR